MSEMKRRVGKAVKHFWAVRESQAANQGSQTGLKDAGLRSAVTGGKHLDGFVSLCRDLMIEAGLPEANRKGYEILLTKLLRERLYDGACLLLSTSKGGIRGRYREPSEELSFDAFARSFLAHAIAFARTRG